MVPKYNKLHAIIGQTVPTVHESDVNGPKRIPNATHPLTRNVCAERDEGYEAEHPGQRHVDPLAPVGRLGALDHRVQHVRVEVQVERQQRRRLDQHKGPHGPVVEEGEAAVLHGVQVMHAAPQEPLAQLLQPAGQQREQHLQGQEEPAVHQPPATAHHRQVHGEGDEGGVVEGRQAAHLLDAHHGLAQPGAQQPAAPQPPVDDQGPQTQGEQVAAADAQDEHGHVAADLAAAPRGQQAGQQRDQEEDVEGEAGHQQENLGGGAEVQVGGDGAGRG